MPHQKLIRMLPRAEASMRTPSRLRTVLVAWIASVITTKIVELWPEAEKGLKSFDTSVLTGLVKWQPWEIFGTFIRGGYPQTPTSTFWDALSYFLSNPRFIKEFPDHACGGFISVFQEMVSGGWVAWITTGVPAACSLLGILYLITADGWKQLIRFTHPFLIFMLCVFFLTLTVAAGTALWVAAEFSKGVVWIIGYLLPDHLSITKTPTIAAVFALTWTLVTQVAEELIDTKLPGSKR
jgi:hypothetical protein